MSLLIKICGVTDPAQAAACVAAGADVIGVNLWPGSPRCVDLAQAGRIAAAVRAAGGRVAGIFVEAAPDAVAAALALGLDVAQLHGDEPPEVAALLPAPPWKALRLSSVADLARLDRYPAPAWPLLVLDAPCAGYGGSGQRLDPALAAQAAARRAVLLAGGLTPDNVAAAVAAVRPAGVDVASGVESRPGDKDLGKVRAFIAAARAAAAPAAPDPRRSRP